MEREKVAERWKKRRKILKHLTTDFRINLLGPPEILVGGRIPRGRLLDRPFAIFVYLATSGGVVGRSQIMRVFWGEEGEKEASSALSRALYELELRGLGPLMEKNPSALRFRPPRGLQSSFDIGDFTDDSPPPYCRHLHAPSDCPGCAQKIQNRLSLIRGKFLEGVDLPPDCGPFESWILERRVFYEEMANRLRTLLSSPLHREFAKVSPSKSGEEKRILSSGEHRKVVVLSILASYPPSVSHRERLTLSQQLRKKIEEIIGRHGGWLPPPSTAGIQGYFGFPGSLEFAPRLAASAAREILDSLPLPPPQGSRQTVLTFRMGILEGEVTSDILRGIPDVTGELTTSALTLAQSAPEGSIAVAPSLFSLLTPVFLMEERISRLSPDGHLSFDLHLLGPRRSTPLSSSLYEGTLPLMNPPFVGRTKESRLINSLWRSACKGEIKTILITGEAGIGKSRLLSEVLENIQKESPGTIIRKLSCLPEDRETPWAPVRWLFRSLLGLEADLSQTDLILRTESYLASLDKVIPEESALFLQFIEGTGPWSAELSGNSPLRIRQKIEKLVGNLVLKRSQKSPLILLFEDIQWADSATLSLLRTSVLTTEASRILVLLSSRDDQTLSRHHLFPNAVIQLAPLSPKNTRELLSYLFPQSTVLSPSMKKNLVQQSGGNPFFLIELVRSESEGKESQAGSLTSTLDAQIDALGEASHTLALSACLGLRFSRSILTRILGSARLKRHEPALFRRGLITTTIETPHILEFRHALLRDHILKRFPPETLRLMHRKIAQTLSALFEGAPEGAPEIVARHYVHAGDPEAAIPLYRIAAERALALGATHEGWEALERALSLIPPGDPRRLPILVSMGPVAAVLFGYAHATYLKVYREARSLLQESGITRNNLPVWNGLRATLIGSEGPHAAREIAREIREFSDTEGTGEEQLRARYAQGNIAYYGGQLDEAEGYLREALSLLPMVGEYPPGASLGPYAEDPGVTALTYMGAVRLLRGYAGEARLWQEQAIGRSHRSSQTNSLCHAKTMEIIGLIFTRQREATRQAAESLGSLARDRGYPQWVAFAELFGGWSRGGAADVKICLESREFLSRILPGLLPLFLTIESEALLFAGLPEESRRTASLSLSLIEKTGSALLRGKALQIQGEARLIENKGDPEARSDFNKAFEYARNDHNALFALQAAISLQRHFSDNPENLAKALSAVTDGEFLPPVLEARALLSKWQ